MSLVPTWVQSKEGYWYKNPTVRGEGWFICWDDDEPIEIVAQVGINIRFVLSALKEQGWWLSTCSPLRQGVQRNFDGEFLPAVSQFLKQQSNGPTDAMLEGNKKFAVRPAGDCVYYSSTKNGNGGAR